jgi:hypothetical protein
MLALAATMPLVLSCSAEQLGEIVIAIRTDVSVPKDVDRILIDVTVANTGASVFTQTYVASDPDRTFKLPATIGFTASEKDPSAAVRIRVVALRGELTPRMIREVVTTAPTDRTVVVPIPIEFLCDGMAEVVKDAATGKPIPDADGHLIFKSTCPDATTCSAGRCVDVNTPLTGLAEYDGPKVFGGGTGHEDGDCFDAAACFDGAPLAVVDMKACTITAGNDVNVGLVTQGGGSCGAAGCFVPLDAESDAGWQPDPNGTLRLPRAVCDKLASHSLGGVVAVPAGKSPCARKQTSLPICGAFSSAGTYVAPSATAPVVVASGQQNPVSLGVEETMAASHVYWTTRGTFDANSNPQSDGAVKRVQTTGEEAVTIAEGQASPHDLAIVGSQGLAFWSNASGGAIMTSRLDPTKATSLITGLGRPEGVAVDGANVIWTDLTSNQVSSAALTVDGVGAHYGGKTTVLATPDAMASAPRRVAASNGLWCWSYEIKLDSSGGVVACLDASTPGNAPVAAAAGQYTPRSIAVVATSAGKGTVYFASFAARGAHGGVYSVPSTGGTPKELTTGHAGFEDGEDYPSGLALDGDTIYWTSRTRGAVMRLAGGTLTEIATHQRNPGAIAVGKDAIYWVNEGNVDQPDGAIVRHAK